MKPSAVLGLAACVLLAGCGERAKARAGDEAAGGTPAQGGSAGSGGGSGAAGSTASAGASGSPGLEVEECAAAEFAWPHGAKAAVSLTYDDGLPSQLSNAAPALAESALTATFFLSESFGGFEARKPEYQALVTQGFEMGSHTVKHPCFGLSPDLNGYDQATLAAEVDQNIETLRGLGMNGALTFAYPCGNRELGEPKQSYVPLIEERFLAARGVNCCAQAAAAVDLFDVNTNWPAPEATPLDVTAPVDEAITNGTWLVFGFHAVGAAAGEWSAVPQETHDALVAHLVARESELWVATFGAVAEYVQRCR